MEDKLPNKFVGSFITLVGTGIILRFFSSLIDRVFFSNSDFKIVEHEYFGSRNICCSNIGNYFLAK